MFAGTNPLVGVHFHGSCPILVFTLHVSSGMTAYGVNIRLRQSTSWRSV